MYGKSNYTIPYLTIGRVEKYVELMMIYVTLIASSPRLIQVRIASVYLLKTQLLWPGIHGDATHRSAVCNGMRNRSRLACLSFCRPSTMSVTSELYYRSAGYALNVSPDSCACFQKGPQSLCSTEPDIMIAERLYKFV